MPHTYNYDEPLRLISNARLSSYRISIQPANNAELFGSYSWNLTLVGAFYPLLQIIEVALRNAINNAAVEKITCGPGQYWFDCLPNTYEQNAQGQNTVPEQVKKFKEKIKKAKADAKKSLEDKGHPNPNPTLDHIICHTDFSTWEYILDKHFYNGSDNSFLWPNGLAKAFRRFPHTQEKNPLFHQRDLIRRRIEEVRSFRNRISHNEPAWRIADIQKKEDIIQNLTSKLKNFMELLYWISPKFHNYVNDIGIQSRILQILNISELNRYMHSFTNFEIKEIDGLLELVNKANNENVRHYFNINGTNSILQPHSTKLFQ